MTMTIQVLISTMHQTDYSLLEKMKISSDAVVVNQCDREGAVKIQYNGFHILWINTTERGLSKSRNMAIRNATADICMIADDDMEYRSEYTHTVLSAFERIDADIIGFQVRGIEGEFKKYKPDAHKISYLQSMKMASVEIAFKRSAFTAKDIRFDEYIGAGTEFLMGEENALLFQALNNGLCVYYIPKVIADLHIGNSTWRSGFNEKFFVGKGAAFAAMKTPFTTLLIWQWAIRKRGLYKNSMSVFNAVKWMQMGKKAYLKKAKG